MKVYNQLELREVFHLEFLRWLGRKVKAEYYALKGGVNLRFFFQSMRYSEDMDLDAHGIRKDALLDAVMEILGSASFKAALRPFGIERVIPPDIAKAKQTQTTQRFKVHLITPAGEDLFTKIEFSRRGFRMGIAVDPVLDNILRSYKLAPLLIPHYDIGSTIEQKLDALIARTVTQARDIFDLYILSPQWKQAKAASMRIGRSKIDTAREKIFEIDFAQFRDTVISYLSAEDQNTYNKPDIWDEVKLKVVHFLEESSVKNG